MIRVIVELVPPGLTGAPVELARMEIVNQGQTNLRRSVTGEPPEWLDPNYESDLHDYTIKYGVERGADKIGLYSRTLYGFPRLYTNVLGLVRAALQQLEEEELKLDGHPGHPGNLARRLDSAFRAFRRT